MKLQNRKDFAISRWSIELTLDIRKSMKSHDEFLKQPLTLGMFVPCDKNGNVLQDPNPIVSTLEKGEIFNRDVLETWEKAKEKVLFKGFEEHVLLNGETKRLTSPNGKYAEYIFSKSGCVFI